MIFQVRFHFSCHRGIGGHSQDESTKTDHSVSCQRHKMCCPTAPHASVSLTKMRHDLHVLPDLLEGPQLEHSAVIATHSLKFFATVSLRIH